MPVLTPKTRLTVGLALGLCFMALISSISLRSSDGFASTAREVESVHFGMQALDQSFNTLIRVDTIQRGILIGRNKPADLDMTVEGRRFRAQLSDLASYVKTIPGAAQYQGTLAKSGMLKLADTLLVLETLRTRGRDAARAMVRAGHGYDLMSQAATAEDKLSSLLTEELKTLATQRANDQAVARTWLELSFCIAAVVAVVATLLAMRNAGRRQEVEDNLRQVLALQTSILNSVSSAIIATDLDGNVTVFNRTAETMLGYDADEMVGRQTPLVLHEPAELKRHAEETSAAEGVPASADFSYVVRNVSTGKPDSIEWTYVRKDGSKFPGWLTLNQIRDAEGGQFGFVGLIRDLTEERQTQAKLAEYVREIEAANKLAQEQNLELLRSAEELKESRDAAITATRMKSEFLANMSHEIRTPMNGVIGMAHLLMNTPLTEKQLGYARTVQQSAESLLLILNDILDLSKMEAGKMTLENFPFDLKTMLEDLCGVMAPVAHGKKLELNCVIPPSAPSRVIGDPGRLRQILTNLMANAIKFTERGEVSVTVRVLKENQKRVTLRILVADTGIGISPERQSQIFESFTQADGSTTRKFGGTGLGLTISKQLAELMGGEIGVNSSEGEGSEFWLEIALQKQPAEVTEPEKAPQNLDGIRVLVADDNATNRYILREMLNSWNCRIEEAANGTEALSAISLSGKDPFACVVMDLNMPGMDGLQAARAIKRDARHKDLPLILLSSSGFVPDDTESASFFASVQSKPVRSSPLFNALSLITGITTPVAKPEAPASSSAEHLLKGLRVLVVEDNAVNQLVVTELLEGWGCLVVAASNGLLAVEATATEKFDAILMDVQMPVMDGFEATAAIRAQEEISKTHTEIIAMTANAMAGDRERCLKAGMDSYLSKPLQPAALLEKLAVASGRTMVGTPNAVPPEPVRRPTFDEGRLDESCSGSRPLKLKVIERYRATSLDSLAQIVQAAAASDGPALRSAAHALKGSSLTIGATEVGELCQQLESVAEKTHFEKEATSLSDALRTALTALHADLGKYVDSMGQATP